MSKVSRSAYQKVVEENKRLKAEIRTLVEGDVMDIIKLKTKYRETYENERALNGALKRAAISYLNENPELKKTIEGFGKSS